jgi:hypothetical protein
LLALVLEAPHTSGQASAGLGIRTAAAQHVLDDMGTRLGEPCEGVVAHVVGTASLDDLRAAKELAKRLATRAEGRAQQDAAAFLYHLAVAAALCRYAEHISTESLHYQKDIYRRLARLFQGDATGQIFENASQ